jgi:hypothetical protein
LNSIDKYQLTDVTPQSIRKLSIAESKYQSVYLPHYANSLLMTEFALMKNVTLCSENFRPQKSFIPLKRLRTDRNTLHPLLKVSQQPRRNVRLKIGVDLASKFN